MERYQGMKAAEGVAIGRIKQLKLSKLVVEKRRIEDCWKEQERFLEATRQAEQELQQLWEIARKKLGEDTAAIFDGWLLIAKDPLLAKMAQQLIEQEHVNAEFALDCVMKQYIQALGSAEEDYMRERVSDIQEVEERILSNLLKKSRETVVLTEKCILVSKELTPEHMIRLDRNKILAFVMAGGSVRSHAAIMARILGVPAIVAVGEQVLHIPENQKIAVDGYTGEIFIEPSQQILQTLERKAKQEQLRKERLRKFVDVDTITKSGKKIRVYANISSEEELDQVQANGGEGVGLFRSEWLYLERSTYPSEEMQVIAYSKVLKKMGGKRVVIRTLDVGGDKKAEYMKLREEENPVLGLRGIRVCFENISIFKTQLRALYRASVQGNLAILFPMISSVWEVQKIKQIVNEVKEELHKEQISYREVELGIMIETPAAAMISDELAEEVDFFSIGTNDLTQYTLAVDRQNPAMECFYNSTHRAIMKLIELTAQNGKKKGIPVSICGELGADTSVTQRFLDMGITAFSVNPPQILALKEKLLSCG